MSPSISNKIFLLALFVIPALCLTATHQAAALSGSDWRAGNIIDDSNFYRAGGLSPGNIQNFLNQHLYDPATDKYGICDTNGSQPYAGTTRGAYGASKGYPPPYTCLKDFTQSIPGTSADAYCDSIPGGNYSAASIIWLVSQTCHIDSASLIVLIEKEESLVSDPWPWPTEYRIATGYGCPDTAACDSKYYGFFNQVYNAAWQFKYYAANSSQFRYKPYQNNTILYNPNAACGSSTVYIENRATAGLYNYTPYQPNQAALNNLRGSGDGCSAYGNRNFWRLIYDWFGLTTSPTGMCDPSLNNQSAGYGLDVIKYNFQNNNNLALLIQNKTGTGCSEVHPWNPSEQSWASHIETNMISTDPSQGKVLVIPGAPSDKLVYVKYHGAGDRIEVHEWSSDLQHWSGHYLTNQQASELQDGTVMSAGGKLVFVKYHGAGGHIEAHEWAPGYQSWSAHYVTNQASSELDNGNGTIVTRLYSLVFIKYHGAGDRVEMHEWAPGYQSWSAHYVTNQAVLENLQPQL
jgi:hypothetical protein